MRDEDPCYFPGALKMRECKIAARLCWGWEWKILLLRADISTAAFSAPAFSVASISLTITETFVDEIVVLLCMPHL